MKKIVLLAFIIIASCSLFAQELVKIDVNNQNELNNYLEEVWSYDYNGQKIAKLYKIEV